MSLTPTNPGECLGRVARAREPETQVYWMQEAIKLSQFQMVTPFGGVLIFHPTEDPACWYIFLLDGYCLGKALVTGGDHIKTNLYLGFVGEVQGWQKKALQSRLTLMHVLSYLLGNPETPAQVRGALVRAKQDLLRFLRSE
jgi:hypothetical protein